MKKIISIPLALVFVLLFVMIGYPGFANSQGYSASLLEEYGSFTEVAAFHLSGLNIESQTIYPGYKIVTEEEERNLEQKNRNVDRGYVGEGVFFYPSEEQRQMVTQKREKGKNRQSISEDFSIMGPVYEDGTTQVVSVTPYSNGTLVQQDRVKGITENVWNIGMYVAGKIFKTVGSILLDIINFYADTLDKSKGSETYTYVSYRYIGKDVLVYDTGRWELWYQAKSRENYAHTLSTYVNAYGLTRTHNRDYTIDEGYYPVKTDFSPNYNNDSELAYRGWYNWMKDYNAYRYPEYGY